MTDREYELDVTGSAFGPGSSSGSDSGSDDGDSPGAATAPSDDGTTDRTAGTTDTWTDGPTSSAERALSAESVGVTVPDEHVGAFVAQAFEDPERDTDWETVVETVVAADARDAWEALSPCEQAIELLAMADDYDERAVELLDGIPTGRSAPTDRIDRLFEEAMRCRRNADRLRDGIAAAYASGYLSDDALVAAVEDGGFDTTVVAARENRLETVAEVYDYDFRPYGGTLLTTAEHEEDGEAYDAW